MNKFFTNSFKAFAIVALLSTFNGFAMEKASEAVTVAEVVVPVTVAEVIVVTEPAKAVETVKAAATEAIEAVKAQVAPVETKKACTNCFSDKIKNGWNKAVASVSNQKAAVFAAAKDMKARGWTGWTNKEKAGVVIGGTAVAAVTAFLVYKAYKAFTAPKAKANARNNRA